MRVRSMMQTLAIADDSALSRHGSPAPFTVQTTATDDDDVRCSAMRVYMQVRLAELQNIEALQDTMILEKERLLCKGNGLCVRHEAACENYLTCSDSEFDALCDDADVDEWHEANMTFADSQCVLVNRRLVFG